MSEIIEVQCPFCRRAVMSAEDDFICECDALIGPTDSATAEACEVASYLDQWPLDTVSKIAAAIRSAKEEERERAEKAEARLKELEADRG